jgi:hypothetical protein
MLSVFEKNVGAAIYGAGAEAREMIDLLGQGDGRRVCAQWFSRARRMNPNAENVLYGCAAAAELVVIARKQHPQMNDDQCADLIAFIFERGVNMKMGPA